MSDSPSTSKIIVAMPAYNEEKYIGSVLLLAQQYADEVIVVDDGSLDHTSKVANLAGVTVIRQGERKGYGMAIQTILAEAKKRKPDVLVIMDADSQHNPEEIPSLINAISKGFDIAIGSRRIGRDNIPPYRQFGQKILAYLTGILSGRKVSDTESGFRAYSKRAIAELELKERGMAVSAEIISAATQKGLRVAEVPVSAIYTKDGSTLNPVKHGVGVLQRIMVMISERRPLLFFGVGGTLFTILGLVAGISVVKTVYAMQALQTGTALISMLFITVGILCIFTGIILDVIAKRAGKRE